MAPGITISNFVQNWSAFLFQETNFKMKIMKQITGIIMLMIVLLPEAKADNHRTIKLTELPPAAQTFIKQHFSGLDISYTARKQEFLNIEYNVFFVDGNKVEFNKSGAWEEINFRFSEVPPTAIPQNIREFVRTKHPESRIIQLEKDSGKTEVELSNGLELNFDNDFNFIGVDD